MGQLLLLVVAALFGYAGYREARGFARRTGRPPWGWDPIIWGLIVFFGGIIIGAILLVIARRTTKPAPNRGDQIPFAPSTLDPPAVPAGTTTILPS